MSQIPAPLISVLGGNVDSHRPALPLFFRWRSQPEVMQDKPLVQSLDAFLGVSLKAYFAHELAKRLAHLRFIAGDRCH